MSIAEIAKVAKSASIRLAAVKTDAKNAALDEIAGKLTEIKNNYGPEAIAETFGTSYKGEAPMRPRFFGASADPAEQSADGLAYHAKRVGRGALPLPDVHTPADNPLLCIPRAVHRTTAPPAASGAPVPTPPRQRRQSF